MYGPIIEMERIQVVVVARASGYLIRQRIERGMASERYTPGAFPRKRTGPMRAVSPSLGPFVASSVLLLLTGRLAQG